MAAIHFIVYQNQSCWFVRPYSHNTRIRVIAFLFSTNVIQATSSEKLCQTLPMSDLRQTFWTPTRIAAWGILAAIVVFLAGRSYVHSFLAPKGGYSDFVQEWLSVRNHLGNSPVYREISPSLQDHLSRSNDGSDRLPKMVFTDPQTGTIIAEMKYNAHPPVAVVIALPFCLLEYPQAHLAWNLVTYLLFLGAVIAVLRELRIQLTWPALFPAVILLLANPLLNQIYQGQLNCLLAVLVTAGWIADRRDRKVLAGICVGLAGAVKLYPLFLLLYFAFTRRWQGLLAAVMTFIAANGLAAAVLGTGAFRDYFGVVMPSVAGEFETHWANLSLSGFWKRLARTEPIQDWFGPSYSLVGARILGFGFAIVVCGLVAWTSWQTSTTESRDRAWALGLVGMMLASPIAWSHYCILFLMPLGFLWTRSTPRALWLVGICVAILWLPTTFVTKVVLGSAAADRFSNFNYPRLTTVEDLALISVPHYALVGLFCLILKVPANLSGRRFDPEAIRLDTSTQAKNPS